ncbi:MAG: hypothetical protein WCI90_08905 [Chlorobium sp.]
MMHNTQQPAGLDKRTVGRGFTLFFAGTFVCLIIYYWPLFKTLLHDHMHYQLPF